MGMIQIELYMYMILAKNQGTAISSATVKVSKGVPLKVVTQVTKHSRSNLLKLTPQFFSLITLFTTSLQVGN